MNNVYRLLHWLDMSQAVEYLQSLTGTPISSYLLLQLCEGGQCPAYADVGGLTVFNYDSDGQAIAYGIHLVKNPVDAFSGRESRTLNTEGDALGTTETEWYGSLPQWKRGPIFKPADIEALAASMVGTLEQPDPIELESLRQEVEQARADLQKAQQRAAQVETEAANMRREELQRRDALLEQQATELEQERAARAAAEKRAEIAEAEAKPSHMLTIVAPLELLKAPVVHPRLQGMKQEAIKTTILEKFPWRGLSKRNLEDIFAAANKARQDAE